MFSSILNPLCFLGDLRDKELRRAIPRAHIEVGATQEADVSFSHQADVLRKSFSHQDDVLRKSFSYQVDVLRESFFHQSINY